MGLLVSWQSFCIDAMVILLLLFFGSHVRALHGAATSKMGGNETDRLALLEFKAKIIDDPLGAMSSWNDTVHFCHWYGVQCGRRHQRVTVLDLRSLKLAGSISPHIGNLSFLRQLNLQNNSFSHQIPPEFGRLHRLHELRLHNNSIGGEIPANISDCSDLVNINLGRNQLLGEIPMELTSLLKLKYFGIHFNNLIGSIPPSLGNLSSLEALLAAGNNLDGSLPDSLGELSNLTRISLGANRLSGTIPSSIFNLSSLEVFDVGQNQIQGSLPSNLGITLPNLQFLSISSNRFTGPIPISISNASNLKLLQISKNELTGKVPSLGMLHKLWRVSLSLNYLGGVGVDELGFLCSLTNATTLEVLALNGNNFGGVLPWCIGNLSTALAILSSSRNKIHGVIPAGLRNLVNLERLEMRDNQLSGNIPPELGKLEKLKVLLLNRNKFSANIPSSLGNLKSLIDLRLNHNNLQGHIPSSLGECQNLLILDLSHNNISGFIPLQAITLSSLSIVLDLSQNHLSGGLPMEVGNLKNLGVLDISENMLSGEIPSSLGSCTRLEILHMQGNFFHGSIPSSVKSLRAIQILDLAHNNLSGEIPNFLEDFDLLLNLNLSYNNFEGRVPSEGVFKNASAASVIGNSKLCGGIPELQLPICNFEEPIERRLSLHMEVIISIVSGLLGATLVISLLLLYWLRKKRTKPAPTTSLNLLTQVSYHSLFKATDGFSSVNLIGLGSFGSVYKGILDHNRTIVAIKVLNIQRRGASKSFIAECEALRNIRHRNLVKIITACSSVDFHGNNFKALVYEFMANGSLEEWLHPIFAAEETYETPRKLNLLQRLNIAIDVASALEYLHNHCQRPIVHCDLKPSNILLDSEMLGHLTDFGLSRILLETTNFPNQSSSIGIRGSVGYIAPEYGMRCEVSACGDVYSYGILLLELFSGKRPTDNMFDGNLNLHNYVKRALPEQVVRIIDPILVREDEASTSTSIGSTCSWSCVRNHKIKECLTSIFGIGIACSMESPSERMDISGVTAELHAIRDILAKTRIYGEETTMPINPQ